MINRDVFINCPFDAQYRRFLNAIVFVVSACKFRPRSALESSNAKDSRIKKIVRIIGECRYGIHDLSRIGLGKNKLPRFNMPLELGIDLGCAEYGTRAQRDKRLLVMEALPFQYQRFASDLSGQDILAHRNKLSEVVRHVRNFLSTESKDSSIAGHSYLLKRYDAFEKDLPEYAKKVKTSSRNLTYTDMLKIVGHWLQENPV